jgi:flavorubredoxin
MFIFYTGLRTLFSSDASGNHYACAFRFNDEEDREELFAEALKYFANILTPFSALVGAKIDEVLDLKLPLEVAAPSQGVIWRKDILRIVDACSEYASQRKMFRTASTTKP